MREPKEILLVILSGIISFTLILAILGKDKPVPVVPKKVAPLPEPAPQPIPQPAQPASPSMAQPSSATPEPRPATVVPSPVTNTPAVTTLRQIPEGVEVKYDRFNDSTHIALRLGQVDPKIIFLVSLSVSHPGKDPPSAWDSITMQLYRYGEGLLGGDQMRLVTLICCGDDMHLDGYSYQNGTVSLFPYECVYVKIKVKFLKEFLEQDQDWKLQVGLASLVIDSKSRAKIRAFVRFLEGRREVKYKAEVRETTGPNPRTITNSIGMTLILIPAGEFMMGSDATDPDARNNEFLDTAASKKEKHRVRITQPFYLGVTEVTRGQFRQFVDDTDYRTEAEKDGEGGWNWNEKTKQFEQNPRFTWQNPGFDQTDEHPVVNVSWNDAQAFIGWLSQKAGKNYRLPTEAEWEYACRAGTTSRYSCGDDPEGLAAVGNVADGTAKAKHPDWETIAARDGYIYTAPTCRFRPNAFSLFDMHGNVSEWCSDAESADYYKQSPVDDPPGALGVWSRVIRGGGWKAESRFCRSASRYGNAPNHRDSVLGFRVARVQSGP